MHISNSISRRAEQVCAFGSKVKGCSSATGPITPVDCSLTVAVLVVIQHSVCVLTSVPELAESQLRHCCVYVFLGEFSACEQAAAISLTSTVGNA